MRKIRKLSNKVLREENESSKNSKSLEWRRSYNSISMELNNITVATRFRIHDIPSGREDDGDFIPSLTKTVVINGLVNEDRMRDSIYCAKNIEDGKVIVPRRIKGKMRVELLPYDSDDRNSKKGDTQKIDEVPKKTVSCYRGSVFRMDFEPGNNDLYFGLPVPVQYADNILNIIEKDSKSVVIINVRIQSFTSEVDDALREYWHPQKIILFDGAFAYVVSMSIETSFSGDDPAQNSVDDENCTEKLENELEESEIAARRKHEEDMSLALTTAQPLRSLSLAAWAIFLAIAVSLATRIL